MGEQKNIAEYLKIALCIAAGILIAWAAKGKILGIILPLTLAYVGAKIAAPQAKFLSRACHINPKVGGAIYALFICGVGVYIVVALSHKLIDELWSILEKLPTYAENAVGLVENIIHKLPFSDKFTESTGKWSSIFVSAAEKLAEYVGGSAAKLLGNTVQSFPRWLMSAIVGIVGFVYLTSDMEGAGRCIWALVPRKHVKKIRDTAKDIGGALFAYLRAYATLGSVTFLILSTGLSIVGASNPLATALIIAFIDALPVLGCGSVLIPWSIWCFLSGELGRGIGILIVLGTVYVVRQLLEPRIIGKMTGVHPFVALSCVFIGLKLGGIGGMIIAPIILSCVVQMIRTRGE